MGKTLQPITKLSHQNAEGSRTHQAHEAQRRAGRHRREEGGVEGRVHQAAVGLHLRRRPHPRLRHGQVPFRPPLLISQPFILPKKNQMKIYPHPTFVSLRTNDLHIIYSPIRPTFNYPEVHKTTQVPPSPNWKMPNPKTGVDDGAFFKAARRTAIRRAESHHHRVNLFEVLPRFIKIATTNLLCEE